mmetsp:Transcript_2991/g.7626  ORF Transcript_2991/g.7626 Transcript_2991/m.7626 type:complete len:359 (+) Transcript_2991:196-1272(+)
MPAAASTGKDDRDAWDAVDTRSPAPPQSCSPSPVREQSASSPPWSASSPAVPSWLTWSPPASSEVATPTLASSFATCMSPAVHAEDMWRLSDFELGPRVGAGTFGSAQLARESKTGTVVVLKTMRKRRIARLRVQRHVRHEIEIQGHLRHHGVLRLFGYFWDAKNIYMILEHAPCGDLHSLREKQPGGRFKETRAAEHIATVVGAIAYCHSVHVIHRDLKPQNILVARGGTLKLADFGWAVHSAPGERRWTLCGTLDYLPPEMVHVTNGHSFEVDVWGVGILTHELLTGDPPFAASAREETYKRILAASPVFPEAPEPWPSTDARAFVCMLLQRNPAERPSPQDAAEHAWLRQAPGND